MAHRLFVSWLVVGFVGACGGRAVIDAEPEEVVVVEDCTPGAKLGCYEGPTSTEGVGACHGGQRTCVADGTGYGACEGAVVPHAQDCATAADETCGAFPECTGDTAWAITSLTPGTSLGTDVAITPDGGVVVVGSFDGVLDLGGQALTRTTPSAFVAKLNGRGELEWVHGAEADAPSDAASVVVSNDGAITVGGAFRGSMSLAGSTLTSAGESDGFVLQLEADGSLRWARAYGSTGPELVVDLAALSGGGFALAGYLLGPSDLGTGSLGFAGKQDIFVMSLDASGTPRWARALGGPGVENLQRIASDGADHITLAGTFEQTLAFGNEVPSLVSAGGRDGFLAQLDASGATKFAHGFTGPLGGHPRTVATATNDSLVVAGMLSGAATTPFGELTAKGSYDTFIGRMSATGESLGVVQLGAATGSSLGLDVSIDDADQTIVLGLYEGRLDLGGGPLLAADGFESLFLSKRDPSLGHIWSHAFGDASLQRPAAIAVDADGGVVITGDFLGTLDFGTGPVLPGEPNGQPRVFVARFVP